MSKATGRPAGKAAPKTSSKARNSSTKASTNGGRGTARSTSDAAQLDPADRSSVREPVERVPHQRTNKIAEVVAREILHDIVGRQLPPGTMLTSESIMLESYQVGRASLREALRILEVHGLIRIKPGPGGGPVVAQVTPRDFGRTATFFFYSLGATIGELMESRLVVEPVMARLAAERVTDASAEVLRNSIRQAAAAVDDRSGEFYRNAHEFHTLVAGMSGNKVLDLVGQSMLDIYNYRVHELFPTEERPAICHVHEQIANAILRGDGSRSERLMRTHLEVMTSAFKTRFPSSDAEVIEWR